MICYHYIDCSHKAFSICGYLSFPFFCHFPKRLCNRVKGGKKGRPRKSQTSEDSVSNENDSISTDGDHQYLLNDGNASSSSFDGSVPNNMGMNDPTMDGPNSMAPGASDASSSLGVNGGGSSDPIDSSFEGLSKDMDCSVPDGSNTMKIKKPRRSEGFDFQSFLHAGLRHSYARCSSDKRSIRSLFHNLHFISVLLHVPRTITSFVNINV